MHIAARRQAVAEHTGLLRTDDPLCIAEFMPLLPPAAVYVAAGTAFLRGSPPVRLSGGGPEQVLRFKVVRQ